MDECDKQTSSAANTGLFRSIAGISLYSKTVYRTVFQRQNKCKASHAKATYAQAITICSIKCSRMLGTQPV